MTPETEFALQDGKERDDEYHPITVRDSSGATVDAGGLATIELGAPPLGCEWVVKRYSICGETPVAVVGVATVYYGGATPLTFVETTDEIPNVSVWADEQLVLRYGERLVIAFSGIVAGTRLFANGSFIQRRAGTFEPMGN